MTVKAPCSPPRGKPSRRRPYKARFRGGPDQCPYRKNREANLSLEFAGICVEKTQDFIISRQWYRELHYVPVLHARVIHPAYPRNRKEVIRSFLSLKKLYARDSGLTLPAVLMKKGKSRPRMNQVMTESLDTTRA